MPTPTLRIDPQDFIVPPGHAPKLPKRSTRVHPFYTSKDHYQSLLERHIQELSSLQNRLYAVNRDAVLVIFQAMDAAGKDSMIRHVMSGVNPQGCQVFSFKHPSAEELEHDFLWRSICQLPERGRIGIFNRSYYEEVLIVRVHPEILRGESLPDPRHRPEKDIWGRRFQSIVNLERHLRDSGTHIVKFFLHVSKEEQRKRLLARIEDPEKNWKITIDDVNERGYWKDYMRAYEACLAATSAAHAPWHIVPADDKPNAQLIVSETLLSVLRKLDLKFPQPDAARRKELRQMRARLGK